MAEFKFPPLLEILKRRFSAEYDGTLGDQVVPTVALEVDRPEWAFLQGERLWAAPLRIEQAAAANQFVICQLLNPTGSNIIAVVERAGLVHSCGVAVFGPSEYRVGVRSSALSNNLVGGARDLRWNAPGTFNARPMCTIRSTVNAVDQLDLDLGRMVNVFGAQLAGSCQYGAEWNDPLVIPPGHGVAMETVLQTASRNDFQFTWVWRERQMAPWERAQSGA